MPDRAWLGSPFDRQLAARAAGYALVAGAVTFAVVAATDEGGGWSRRAAMTAALLPAAGAIGAFAGVGVAAHRGELRALGALGVTASRARAGAAVGGVLVALAAPFALRSSAADARALFPTAPATQGWVADGGALVSESLGVRVSPGFSVTLAPRGAAPISDGAPAGTASGALAVAAVALPLGACAAEPLARRVAMLTLALLAAVACFQAVAAGRLAAAWLVAPPLALLVETCFALARERRRA